MQLRHQLDDPGVLIVEFPLAHLDATNVEDFDGALQPLLRQHARVVLDFEQLRFIDSAGLHTLLACARLVDGLEGSFQLCSLSRGMLRLFSLMRLQRRLPIHSSRGDALASFH